MKVIKKETKNTSSNKFLEINNSVDWKQRRSLQQLKKWQENYWKTVIYVNSKKNLADDVISWECVIRRKTQCKARVKLTVTDQFIEQTNEHRRKMAG